MAITSRHLAQDCQDINPNKRQCRERDSIQERTETGDPISPLLFVLINDGLNHMIRKSIHGMAKAPSATYVNIRYADDILIFRQADVKEAIIIKRVLCYFEVWSGLKINFVKKLLICHIPHSQHFQQ